MNSIHTAHSHVKWKGFLKNFLNNGHPRTLKAKENILISFLIKGVSIFTSFLLVPITINYVNPTQYGIWLTLSSLVAWFSFFDIGFGHGLRNKLAEENAKKHSNEAQKYISTTYAIFFLIFGVLWLIFFVLNYFLDWRKILNTDIENRELFEIAIIVFSFFCLQIVLKTINTILIAYQRSGLSSLIDTLGQLLSLAIIFFLRSNTQSSLTYLSLVIGICPTLILIIFTVSLFKNEYRSISPSIVKINFTYAREILGIGIKFFFIQVSAIIIFQTTNIVITQMLGPSYVTIYNILYKYFFSIHMFFIIIITPFWSAFTDAYVKEDYEWMKNSVKQLNNIWLILFPIVIVMLCFCKYFIGILSNEKVSISFHLSLLMATYVLLYTRFNLFIYLINGLGKVKLQLYINMLFCIIYIPLVIVLCKYQGIYGILYGNITIALTHAIVSQIQINKLLDKKAEGIWAK